jgi:excisionase family DNA binding protein
MRKSVMTVEKTVLDTVRPLLTITQAAALLNVTRPTIYAYIAHEALPVIYLGAHARRISPISLDRWLAKREQVR